MLYGTVPELVTGAAAGNCQDTVGEPVRSGRNRWFVDSPLEGNGFERSVPRLVGNGFVCSSELGRSTGGPVIRAVAGLRTPIELSGGGPRSGHSPPGSGGVTPPPHCRRCKRIAEPRVRIRSPPPERVRRLPVPLGDNALVALFGAMPCSSRSRWAWSMIPDCTIWRSLRR